MTTHDPSNPPRVDDHDARPEPTGLARELHDAQERIRNLEAKKLGADADRRSVATLRAEVANLRAQIQDIHASNSWKITAPVRKLSAFGTALRLAIGTVRRQAAQRGGLANALSYYSSVLRREGLSGIRKRLSRLNSGIGFADGPPSDEMYHKWIARFDTLNVTLRAEAQTRLQSLERKPLFSILVPTYNSDASYLREMIKSVRDQIYPHWELCIADDASTDSIVKKILEDEAARDTRIKIRLRQQNGHISEASNSALELASGDYIGLLDHDDVLPPQALLLVAQYINSNPNARMFYSDEDKLSPEGARTMPYFKSDWNPQMFLTQNMFSHFGVFETNLVREAGGFRKGMEGSQDFDLALRCVEIAGYDKVIHIPHILYHWRIVPGSTAGSGSEKPYALVAAIKAVEEHLARTDIPATVEQPFKELGMLRVRYALPASPPKVSILIPTRDGLALLEQCIESILDKTTYPNYEILIIDNGSSKPETFAYFEKLKQNARIRVIRDDSPFNFSALNNRAAIVATGELLCLMNNDIEVISRDWLDEMVSLAIQPASGAVGACLWYPNDALQHGGVLIGLGGIAGHMHHMLRRGQFGYFGRAVATQNLSAVTAACLVIRKSIYDEIGGLDESLAVAFNDVDFCLRVKEAGYRNIWTPYAQLYHHESASRGNDLDSDKIERFSSEIKKMRDRWGHLLEADPAYNPNLSLSVKVLPFTLADPPRKSMLD